MGVELRISEIEMALAKHDRVIVKEIAGNHDPEISVALAVALAAFFASNDRVTVDLDPSPFFWFQFGEVFLAAHHGDKVKMQDFPGVMAAMRPKMWGASSFRYSYSGHVHHKSKFAGELGGVICESFGVLAAPDAWHVGQGYGFAQRTMTAITHHKKHGESCRHTVAVHPRTNKVAA